MTKQQSYSRALQAVTAEARLGARRGTLRGGLRRHGHQPQQVSPKPKTGIRFQ
ncbi:MAG: hypothetical protein U0R71_14405 [Solirubrobacterales bacterium]